jgi:hypothetical protein
MDIIITKFINSNYKLSLHTSAFYYPQPYTLLYTTEIMQQNSFYKFENSSRFEQFNYYIGLGYIINIKRN